MRILDRRAVENFELMRRPAHGLRTVTIPEGDLVKVLDWLSPSASPLIVIGTDAEIRNF
jgi:hypothetical protein